MNSRRLTSSAGNRIEGGSGGRGDVVVIPGTAGIPTRSEPHRGPAV